MENVKITFIGHSTTLIEGGGQAVLTDPIFSPNVLFIKRRGELKYDPGRLPELSAVTISHAHVDHLDYRSFNYIKTTVPVVMPESSGKRITRYLPNPVIELSNWAEHEFANGMKIRAVPATHKSHLHCPHFYENACGYVIELGGKTIFFAGDTTYNEHFIEIGNAHTIDAALLPIGAYKPAIFKRWHMDPVDAVQAFTDLKAKAMIPIHFGAFRLSFEKPGEPAEWLKKIMEERGLQEKIKILEPGEAYIF